MNTTTLVLPDRRPLPTRRVIGLLLLAGLILLALLGPVFGKYDHVSQDLHRVLDAPGAAHLLGTDHLGRDLFARLTQAMRLSLGLAVLCVLAAAVPGTALGILAAWKGGWTERVLVALADAVLALPGLLLVLLFAAIVPGDFITLCLGLALALWVEYFRVVRAMSGSVLAGPQVEASRLLGFGSWYVVRRHLLPELMPVIGTLMSFGAATVVLGMAALGFIGVGLRPPTPELGVMMTELQPYYAEAPWLVAAPIAVLFLFLLALVLLALDKDPR
jgi:peptide/nickel transport system permease protein